MMLRNVWLKAYPGLLIRTNFLLHIFVNPSIIYGLDLFLGGIPNGNADELH